MSDLKLEGESPQLNFVASAQSLRHIRRNALFVDIRTISAQQILDVETGWLAMDASVKA